MGNRISLRGWDVPTDFTEKGKSLDTTARFLMESLYSFLQLLKCPTHIIAPAFTSKIFRLRIEKKHLFDMIFDGNYDWKSEEILAGKFPLVARAGGYEACIVNFNRDISSGDIRRAIKSMDSKNPWSPGAIEHLCAFGAKFPSKKRKYSIIALGSIVGILERYVPSLSITDGQRRLDISLSYFDWFPDCHFLIVRKLPELKLLS